jgi:WD40 repeat protein
MSNIEGLNELLLRCDEKTLVDIVGDFVVTFCSKHSFCPLKKLYICTPKRRAVEIIHNSLTDMNSAVNIRPTYSEHFHKIPNEDLKELLQHCDKNALLGIRESICEMIMIDVNLPVSHQRVIENMEQIVIDALLDMNLAIKRQQETDQNAFAVVLGACGAFGKSGFQMAEAGGRKRASTGLLTVGGDVLSFLSTFLSWEKVRLQCEWEAPGITCETDSGAGPCHMSTCSTMVLTASGNEVDLWDAATGLLKRTMKSHILSCICNCRFFPDGKTVVSGLYDGTLELWDVTSGSLVRTLVGHTDHTNCIDVSPDSTLILSGAMDETWKLWNSKTGKLEHTQQTIGEIFSTGERDCTYPYCCSFSPNGRLVLVAELNMMFYDPKTYQLLRTIITGYVNYVYCCSFAPDGNTIVSSSYDGTPMKLWSTATGQCLRTFSHDGHSSRFHGSCYFSSSGQEIISACGTLSMWTAATGQLEGIIDTDVDTERTKAACVSLDGKYIVSVQIHGNVIDERGFVKMWRVKHTSS